MAEYDKGYSDQILDELIAGEFKRPEYLFDIQPDFGRVPVLDVIRFVSDFNNRELQDKITRYCIKEKVVTLKVDGAQVGSGFQMTDMNAPWDLFPEFQEHPLALEVLFEICGARVLKNSKLSLKPVPQTTAGPGTLA